MSKKLLIKLVAPKMSLRPMDSELKRRMSPSLSLVTIATLTPEPHSVYIEDENVRKINFADSPDLVGITVNVDTTYRAFEIARKYRERGIKVIFGGIYASSKPDDMLDHCDAVCIGEAEEIWHCIINDFLHNTLQKKYYKSDSTSLSFYPVPDWSVIDKHSYLYHNIVIASRGCPFRCEFCYNSCAFIKSPYRNRPIPEVLSDIRALNTKQVFFIDDNLIGNINWLDAFLDELLPMKIIWHAAVSANLVRYTALIKKMADSGCRSLFIGFESINDRSIHSVHKTQNKIDEYEELIRELHKNGIMVNASMVFGFDFDTPETFDRTLNWLVSNKIETMTTHILTPYPGTVLYDRMKSEDRIIDFNLRHYNTSNVVFQPVNMSPEQLKAGYLSMYRKFYSIRNIIKRRPDNNKLLFPYLLFNFGYRKFGKFTSLIGKTGLMDQIGNLARKLCYGID